MFLQGRWIPAPVMTYFIGSTVVTCLLVAILVFWMRRKQANSKKSRLKTVAQRQQHKAKKRKRGKRK